MRGTASALHRLGVPSPAARLVRWCEVTALAIVLGSTQPACDVDVAYAAANGIEVARRRSGGGAVLVEPGGQFWVDVVVPMGDPLWQTDVGRAFWWLGTVWQRVLADLGVDATLVHTGELLTTSWSKLVCFTGLGPGEVTIAGRKVVGISQRRTRDGAVFQCAVLRRVNSGRLAELFSLDSHQQSELSAAFERSVVPVLDVPFSALEAAFLDRLSSL